MHIFDGTTFAKTKELALTQAVAELRTKGKKSVIASVYFTEDSGSQLYTQLKQAAATRVGIEYRLYPFSLQGKSETVVEQIQQLNQDTNVTGIIIQKPWQRTWQKAVLVEGEPKDVRQAYAAWWTYLTSALSLAKDVDGLHPSTMQAIEQGTRLQEGKVMPATAQAVLEILKQAQELIAPTAKYVLIGRSDLLGVPLYFELMSQGKNVELIGKRALDERIASGKKLLDADVVVSATGVADLITGDLLKEGVVVVDVGEPKPDVERSSVVEKAAFLTPVPGGVGPMTIVCLLENSVKLLL